MKRLVHVLPGLLGCFLFSLLICATIRGFHSTYGAGLSPGARVHDDNPWTPYWTAILVFQTGVLLMLFTRLARAWVHKQITRIDRAVAAEDWVGAEHAAAVMHRGVGWLFAYQSPGSALDEVGLRCRAVKQYEFGVRCFKQSLERQAAAHGAPLERATTQFNLALTYADMARFAEAEALYDEVLAWVKANPTRRLPESLVQNNRGHLFVKMERFKDAEACAQLLLEWGTQFHDRLSLGRGQCLLCKSAAAQRNFAAARDHARQAVTLFGRQHPKEANEMKRLVAELDLAEHGVAE